MKKLVSVLLTLAVVLGLSLVAATPTAVGAEPGYDSTLVLENKDTNWSVINDGIQGTLEYDSSADLFWYNFSATGLTSSTNYSLIYYADTENRFVDWGGDNPGALIATFMTDGTGNITPTAGSVNLNMDLPCSPDANAYFYDYTASDGYDYATGAKIWLVPTSAYDAGQRKVTAWTPSAFLFETDLIWYDDTDAGDSTVALTVDVPDIVAISATPTSIDFGTVYPGQTASGDNITVRNIGTKTVDVDASVASGAVFAFLQLSIGSGWINAPWAPLIPNLAMGASETVYNQLPVPSGYNSTGTEIATLIFEATAA